MEVIAICENAKKCMDDYYYNNDNSCLYTRKPCEQFKSISEIHLKIFRYLQQHEWSADHILRIELPCGREYYDAADYGGYDYPHYIFDERGEFYALEGDDSFHLGDCPYYLSCKDREDCPRKYHVYGRRR